MAGLSVISALSEVWWASPLSGGNVRLYAGLADVVVDFLGVGATSFPWGGDDQLSPPPEPELTGPIGRLGFRGEFASPPTLQSQSATRWAPVRLKSGGWQGRENYPCLSDSPPCPPLGRGNDLLTPTLLPRLFLQQYIHMI